MPGDSRGDSPGSSAAVPVRPNWGLTLWLGFAKMATGFRMERFVFLSEMGPSISSSLPMETAPDGWERTRAGASACPLPRNRQKLIPNHPDADNSVLIRATHTANDCYYMLKEFPPPSCFHRTPALWACSLWFPWQNSINPRTSRTK